MNQQQYLKEYFQKAAKCVAELRSVLPNVTIHIAQGDAQAQENYFAAAQVFNTRLQQNPLAIVYCENEEHVSTAYKIATRNEIPIRVRAGGHDHEGESSGTNVVTIDVSKMTAIELDPKTKIAKIGAGNRFNRLTAALADKDVMIAHGTCATVCITGFTLGGGWGPWTRKMGMNCEHLKGATMMLGDGSIINVDEKDGSENELLLWALRGGGGMSYGIVTELRIQTFPLPTELIKFELHWNHYDKKEKYPEKDIPTLNILMAWENVIKATDTSQLIGTNLKINARPAVEHFDYTQITHGCCMYGYWEGKEQDLRDFVEKRFAAVPPNLKIDGRGGTNPKEQYTEANGLMSNWDRESFTKVNTNLYQSNQFDQGAPLPPDLDDPAPHKITSRFVNSEGLEADGYKQLLLSLTSPLVLPEGRDLGLFTYVTLGAIVGDYYRQNTDKAENSAFPYKDKLYTIQYQTWWNVTDEEHQYPDPSQKEDVYKNINRAMDWIDAARNFDIPNTSGAFISFKDIAIPTHIYFDKNYEKLKDIKKRFSKDPHNHLRTRKTII
jgi:FAD binding domain/Berberine and berberine like